MLELLGFVALIAVIFGVSMTTAVGIIVKIILWIIGICIGCYILTLLKRNTIFIISALCVIVGVYFLATIDSYQREVNAPCFAMENKADIIGTYADCLENANDSVDARTSTSIIMIIVGVILFLYACSKEKEPTQVRPQQPSQQALPTNTQQKTQCADRKKENNLRG